MIIIFGGAYQGKTDFALNKFLVKEKDVCVCDYDGNIDLSKKMITHLEKFILNKIKNNENVFKYFEQNSERFRDKIIVCDDICCGVVPVEKQMRLYRDNVGKQMQIFCRQAEEVYRVYCGIGEKLK